MLASVTGKTILVTGGAGYLGSSFIKAALKSGVLSIVSFSRSEESQRRLQEEISDPRLNIFIGDIRDWFSLRQVMREYKFDFILHAAALKHVPMCEKFPSEAVKTNIVGTTNVVDVAMDAGVPKVLAISSDKALNPTGVYGSTKTAMERIIVAANAFSSHTKLSCVRYGNLIGSTGSVIPIWKEQAKKGNPITVTDPSMTRFWLPIKEAVQLTARALFSMEGGEIFVPKIKACRVGEIADCISENQVIIGPREGEKHHELLLMPDELVEDLNWSYAVVSSNAKPFGKEYRSDLVEAISPLDVMEYAY